MKLAIPLIVLAVLATVGCADKKAATDSSALNLSQPTAVQPAPVAYTPAPIQTVAPDPAMSTSGAPINAAVAASGTTYTVKSGDTLWKIAATHYGDGKKWKQIADANAGLTPSKLKVGQTITLP